MRWLGQTQNSWNVQHDGPDLKLNTNILAEINSRVKKRISNTLKPRHLNIYTIHLNPQTSSTVFMHIYDKQGSINCLVDGSGLLQGQAGWRLLAREAGENEGKGLRVKNLGVRTV